MLKGFVILLGCQLAGECLHQLLALPLPGPVLGMFLLTLFLLQWPSMLSEPLKDTAHFLLQSFGLLFVPAGVGAIVNINLIVSEWIPITVALVCSTFLSLVVTAYVMHAICSRTELRQTPGPESENEQNKKT
jgi:holin-like protein